jgi:glycosyltransferase involved in cell wall biosynthesis
MNQIATHLYGATPLSAGAEGRPLRIVHCFRSPVGGLFRHVCDLAETQRKTGHQVGIVCDSSTGGNFEDAILDRISPMLSLGIHRFPMRREISLADLAATWRATREIHALKPDVLHAHGAKGGAYARLIGTLLRATGSPVTRIYTPHGGSLQFDPKTNAGRVFFAVERILSSMTDAFIFVSQYEQDAFVAKVGQPKAPMTVALNGLRAEEFAPVTPDADARDFLFIGMMRPLKGPEEFIRALALVRERTGRAPTAWMVGGGDEKPIYEKMVGELGLSEAVTFRTPMPSREAFALAHVVVAPSRHESLPYLILEAAAAGMPTLTTRVGGLAEVFGPDADHLLPPNNVEGLAYAMIASLADPAEAAAVAARVREYICPRFAVEAMAATICRAYRHVVTAR